MHWKSVFYVRHADSIHRGATVRGSHTSQHPVYIRAIKTPQSTCCLWLFDETPLRHGSFSRCLCVSRGLQVCAAWAESPIICSSAAAERPMIQIRCLAGTLPASSTLLRPGAAALLLPGWSTSTSRCATARCPLSAITSTVWPIKCSWWRRAEAARWCTAGPGWAAPPPCAWLTCWSTAGWVCWRPTGGWRPAGPLWGRITASGSSSSGMRWSSVGAALSGWCPPSWDRYQTFMKRRPEIWFLCEGGVGQWWQNAV